MTNSSSPCQCGSLAQIFLGRHVRAGGNMVGAVPLHDGGWSEEARKKGAQR